MIAGYRDGQLIAPFTVEGSCTRIVFEIWLETCLIPLLKPGEWVILDNATFHHGGRITELIEAAGAQVVYLPSYSPDLNRIEKCWAWLKSRIRKCLDQFDCLRDAMEHILCLSAATCFCAAGRWFIMLMLGAGFTAVGFPFHDIAFGDVNRAGAMAASTGDENSFYHKTNLGVDSITMPYSKSYC